MLFQMRHPIDEPGAYSSWVGIQAIKKIQLLTDTDGHGVLTFSRGHGKACESPWFLWDLLISKAVEALPSGQDVIAKPAAQDVQQASARPKLSFGEFPVPPFA